MSDEILPFDDHRRRRDDDTSLVRCARCGALIPDVSTRCPECGVHFSGEAADFCHPVEQAELARSERSRTIWMTAALVAMLIFILAVVLLSGR